jgi:hypothetical protein
VLIHAQVCLREVHRGVDKDDRIERSPHDVGVDGAKPSSERLACKVKRRLAEMRKVILQKCVEK